MTNPESSPGPTCGLNKPPRNKFLHYINVPKHVCTHIAGEKYKPRHKMLAGLVVGVIGVLISHIPILLGHGMLITIISDTVGYGFHGLGLVPFINYYIYRN